MESCKMFKILFTADYFLKLNINRQQQSLMAQLVVAFCLLEWKLVDSQIYVIMLRAY